MIKVHIPTVVLKFFHSPDINLDERPPYDGGLVFQLVEEADGTITATSACWHADHLTRRDMADILDILHERFNVKRVRTLRPNNKRVPGWDMIDGFSQIELPYSHRERYRTHES